MNVTASSSCSEHCSFLGEAYFEDATSGRCYYRNVELDGECFSVGDCVACLLEDETSLNGQSISAAEIVHIWRCGATTVCEDEADKDDEEDEYRFDNGMEVRWLYSRSDMRRESSRPPPISFLSLPRGLFKESKESRFHKEHDGAAVLEERELFLSDQVDDAPLESIKYLISVVRPDKFVREVRRVRKRGTIRGTSDMIPTRNAARELEQQDRNPGRRQQAYHEKKRQKQQSSNEAEEESMNGDRGNDQCESEEEEQDDDVEVEEDEEDEEEEDGDEEDIDLDEDDDEEELPIAEDRVYFCSKQYQRANRRHLDVDFGMPQEARRQLSLSVSQHENVAREEEIMYEEEQEERRRRSEQSMELEYNAAAQQKYGANDLSSPLSSKTSSLSKASTSSHKRRLSVGDGSRQQAQNNTKHQRLLDQYSRAISRLQLHAIPKSLPCREQERAVVYKLLRNALDTRSDEAESVSPRSSGGHQGGAPVVYISGMPGTGKTATVREVVNALQAEARRGELPPFQHVEINGMQLSTPSEAYSEVHAALATHDARLSRHRSGTSKAERLRPEEAIVKLEARFSGKQTMAQAVGVQRSQAMVLLVVDELDYLLTPRSSQQTVLYNLFDWPLRPDARLVVVGIANTQDLPERLGSKIESRIGYSRIIFQSYKHHQVEEIVRSRLGEVKGVFSPDAIEMSGRKVAAFSGDVRQALQLCARAAERKRSVLVRNAEERVRWHQLSEARAEQLKARRISIISTAPSSSIKSKTPQSRWGNKGPSSQLSSVVPEQANAHQLPPPLPSPPPEVNETVQIEDINGAYRELNDSTRIQALKQARGSEVVVLVALGAELRATGLEEASFDAVWQRIKGKMARASKGKTKKYMQLLSPQSSGECLEVCERLAEASILILHYDGQRSSVGNAALDGYNSGYSGMPYMQLKISPHQVAEELSKKDNYSEELIDAIANRFFPVDDGGLWG